MFGFGVAEIVIILIVALIVVGPSKLPEVAKSLGKGYGEFKRHIDDLKGAFDVDDVIDDQKQNKIPAANYKSKFEADDAENTKKEDQIGE